MKICVQTGGLDVELGFARCYETLARLGFEGIDWNIDHALRPGAITSGSGVGNCIFEKDIDEILAYYEEELSLIRKNGLAISQAHAPFPCYVEDRPEMLDYMIEIYKKCILLCDRAGCKNLVIHGHSSVGGSAAATDAVNEKLYTSLIPTLRETNVTVCLENLSAHRDGRICAGAYATPHDAAAAVDRLNALAERDCFGFCLDIGHMNLHRQDLARFIPILGKRIKCLHIHDNAGEMDQHKAPYTGTVDWKAFYTALREIGYDGDLSFETFNQVRLKEEELVEPWLTLICAIGRHFRQKICGQR